MFLKNILFQKENDFMLQYNREAVEELIAGLKADNENVTLENLDKFLQGAGVLVRVHVGRIRGNMELTPDVLGIDASQASLSDFFNDYAKNGSMSFIPANYENELKKIESRLRTAKVRMSIGYENSYMPLATYQNFKTRLQQEQVEYNKVRDKILNDWDGILARFEFALNQALASLNPSSQEKIKEAIMKRIPKKSDYRDSFYMRTSLKAFPVMENVSLPSDELTAEVKEGAVEDNVRMVYELLGGALNEAFEVVNSVYASYIKNRKVPPKTHGALKDAVKRVRARDLFKNVMVTKVTKEMDELSLHLTAGSQDTDELCESLLSKIYGYAKEIKVDVYLNLKGSVMQKGDMAVLYDTMKED